MSKDVKGIPQKAAELAVRAPVKCPQVAMHIQPAERGGMGVIDLPSVIALRAVMRPENEVPVSVDAVFGGRVALDRATSRPSGDLLLFCLRQ